MKILVLGVSGMLGNTVFRYFAENKKYEVIGSARGSSVLHALGPELANKIILGTDVENSDALAYLFAKVKPNVVINCIGLIKQLAEASEPLQAIPINSLLPHRLARLCEIGGARLIHVSTDCVFSGTKGNYFETDPSDANDLYGRSKYLGEVDYPHVVTLRTSIIGHELGSTNGLIDWFLSQQEPVKGFTNAIFSGFPTIELAHIIRDVVLKHSQLSGLYHVASAPISKYDLLKLVAQVYKKNIKILPSDEVKINRSLNADKFKIEADYSSPPWPELINKMFDFK